MPRYFFIVKWADKEDDDLAGTVLPDDQAARSYALRVIRELHDGGGFDDRGVAMVVKNEDGGTVVSIPFDLE